MYSVDLVHLYVAKMVTTIALLQNLHPVIYLYFLCVCVVRSFKKYIVTLAVYNTSVINYSHHAAH